MTYDITEERIEYLLSILNQSMNNEILGVRQDLGKRKPKAREVREVKEIGEIEKRIMEGYKKTIEYINAHRNI